MDSLPSPTQVAKNHLSIYEALYQQVDPAGTGKVGAIEAATFLKKSGLQDDVLMRQGTGLDSPAAPIDWSIKASEKLKYEEMFASLGPINDRLPGAKVKPVMLNSKLPVETLGKIWDLSDIDQDGFLDKEEFMLAMHLIYKALENIPVPSELPPDLVPSSKQRTPGVLPDLLDGPRRASTPSLDSSVSYKNALNKAATPWVVSAAEKAKFDAIFHSLDLDRDGFVTGTDIKSIFLQSGLPAQTLAHIWNLCNVRDNGKLNSEQFALAMYLVNQKLQGVELPTALTPQMVPPTLRPKPSAPTEQTPPAQITPEIDLITGGDESPPAPAPSIPPLTTGNRELDLIAAEYNDLQKERQSLESDISQKEEELKSCLADVTALTQEQDTLTAMLKQLDLQRGEARKRLDNLDTQKINLENNIKELSEKYEEEKEQIESLRKQVEEQQQNIAEQETELRGKQQELSQLQEEERRLEQEITKGRNQVDSCTNSLMDTQLLINKSKLKISQLQEQKRQMDNALEHFEQALATEDPTVVPDSMLSTPLPIDPEARLTYDSPDKPPTVSLTAPDSDDPFKSKDPFAGINGFPTDPFEGEDPFKSVEGNAAFVRSDNPTSASDPFASNDPFADDTFGSSASGKADDPFKGKDPFGLSPSSAKADPFGATFGDKPSLGADPFGTDPFLAPHQPPPRPESPTPQLPPKKGKAPPPRPAPPKHGAKATPSRAAPAPPPPPVNYTPSTFPADPFLSTATPDPFAVSPAAGPPPSAVNDPFDPFGMASAPPASTNDPFAMGGSDPFASSTTDDGFANFANFDQFEEKAGANGWPGATEEEQLAWVTTESLRLEEERRRRQEAAEQADLELAIKLSQTTM